MIIIIIFLGMILLGGWLLYYYDWGVSLVTFMVGLVGLFSSIIIVICAHIGSSCVIQENKIEYDGLCKRYETINSEYEDVSKSDIIADITAWNKKVYSTKYWAENPWTNWFISKKVADNLHYIHLDVESEVKNEHKF